MIKFKQRVEAFFSTLVDHWVIGLEINGDLIHDPYRSPCGRFTADPLFNYGIDPVDAVVLIELNRDLVNAINTALDRGCLILQETIGQSTGDFASMYFVKGAPEYEKLSAVFAHYLAAELNAQME